MTLPHVVARGYLTRAGKTCHVRNYRGRIPAAYARDAPHRPGASTTAGHTQTRRVLVEGAWAYRDPANVRRHLLHRLAQFPKPLLDIRWMAQGRRRTRVRRLLARGTHAHQVVVAMTRALANLMWAIANQVPVTPSVHQTERH